VQWEEEARVVRRQEGGHLRMRARVSKFVGAWLASGAIVAAAPAASVSFDLQPLDARTVATVPSQATTPMAVVAAGEGLLRWSSADAAAAHDFRFLTALDRGVAAAAASGNESLQADVTTSLTVVPFPPTLLMGAAGLLSVIGVHLRRRGK
jgi:hypothetical protein